MPPCAIAVALRALSSLCSRSGATTAPGLLRSLSADSGPQVPDGPQWVYEIEHDGYRFIVRRDDDRVRVLTRRACDWTIAMGNDMKLKALLAAIILSFALVPPATAETKKTKKPAAEPASTQMPKCPPGPLRHAVLKRCRTQ